MGNWQINEPNRQVLNLWSNFPDELVEVILINAIYHYHFIIIIITSLSLSQRSK